MAFEALIKALAGQILHFTYNANKYNDRHQIMKTLEARVTFEKHV